MAKINLDFWKVCLLNWFEDLLCPKVASFLDLCVSSKHEGMESFWLKVVKVVKFPAQRLIVFNVLIVQTPHSIMLMRPDQWPASDHTTDSPQHNLTHTLCLWKICSVLHLAFYYNRKSFLADLYFCRCLNSIHFGWLKWHHTATTLMVLCVYLKCEIVRGEVCNCNV